MAFRNFNSKLSIQTTLLAGASVLSLAFMEARAAELSGTVVSKQGAYALGGAIIKISETGATTTTAQDGSYSFGGLPAGTYTVEISYLGAEATSYTASIKEGESISNVIALTSAGGAEDRILVIGQRSSINRSLNQQRAADNLLSVVSSDAVGQFPDQNVSEATRRLPGLSVENDQGEGRYVIIRGIDPNLNGTSINGIRVPSPEGDGRQVALDVIDADVLSSVEVAKSLTPDMDGDGIGGNVEIKTMSGFDRDGAYGKAKVQLSYNDLVERYGQGIAFTGSNQFADGKLGIAASVSWRERDFGSENKEVDDGEWKEESGVYYPKELELRNYDVTRKRFNASLNLDFKMNGNTDLYARGLFSDFSDLEVRSRVEAKFKDGYFDAANSSSASQIAMFQTGEIGGDDYEIAFDRDTKNRNETQQIAAFSLGGETRLDAITLDYVASYAYSEEAEPDRVDATFRKKFKKDFGFGVDSSNPMMPNLVFFDDASRAAYLDADNFEFDELEHLNGFTADQEWSFAGNITKDIQFGAHSGMIKAGAKARMRHKKRNVEAAVYDGFGPRDLTLGEFDTSVIYPLDQIGPTVDGGALQDFFFANQSEFELDDLASRLGSNASDYSADEDIVAGYVMGRVDMGATRIVGGVRVEQTSFSATASQVTEVEGGATVNGVVFADDDVLVNAVSTEVDYTDWLPSMNIRHEWNENTLIRAAYSRSIARPNIGALVPSAELEQNDKDELEGKLGNPDLNRQVADSFDLSVERYFGPSSAVTLGAFYKRIDDFIAEQGFENLNFGGTVFEQASMSVNIDDASLMGVEFSFQQVFDMLPAPFDNLLAGVNYTYIDGQATLPTGREIVLPKQSSNVANFVVGFDNGAFDARLALGWRDEYLDEIDHAGEGVDRFISEHWQLDASARYNVNDYVAVFAEASNLTNEPYIAFVRDGGMELLSQYEEYSYSLKGGIKLKY